MRRLSTGAWCLTGAVLALLYLPLIPPVLFSVEAESGGFTLAWYARMWESPLLAGAVVSSLEAALIVAVLTPVLALGAAMAVRELKVPRLILVLVLLPLFVPSVSLGLAGAFFFRELGIPPSLLTIVVVQVLWALPFAALIVLTAMSTFDPVLLEAAHMSGAGRWRAFRDVELPLIWPGVSGAATFSFILSFNETVRTSLVQGPLNTVQTYIWSTYKQIGLSPALYALMTLLILLTLLLAVVMLVLGRKADAAKAR